MLIWVISFVVLDVIVRSACVSSEAGLDIDKDGQRGKKGKYHEELQLQLRAGYL